MSHHQSVVFSGINQGILKSRAGKHEVQEPVSTSGGPIGEASESPTRLRAAVNACKSIWDGGEAGLASETRLHLSSPLSRATAAEKARSSDCTRGFQPTKPKHNASHQYYCTEQW